MWLPTAVLIGAALTMHQMHRVDLTIIKANREHIAASQAMQYATAVESYMRTNPGVSGTPTTSQLTTLPTWFPKTCDGDVCFRAVIVSGYGYVTAKSNAAEQPTLKQIDAMQDGSLITGTFPQANNGEFVSTTRGTFNLPITSAVISKTPTIVVMP